MAPYRHLKGFAALLLFSAQATAQAPPTAHDPSQDVTYQGINRNGIELFLNIPYGLDTSGPNRFAPPRPHVPAPNSTVTAQSYGPACPQALGVSSLPLAVGNTTEVSEDCLNLNVARPKGAKAGDKLPVMVWIHGGSFWAGSNGEPTTRPDGLILESIEGGTPVMHVAMNYRLGFFGFAQSSSLRSAHHENAGLRDQRLAIEWTQANIANFGGDPSRITIFGQSSGGLACGLHILAYGGTKPVPFKRGICESQALEPGITGNFTRDAMQAMVDHVGCNTTDLNSAGTIACLRSLDTETLLQASIDTYVADIEHNIGDIWLPSVDGDFLPAPPSQLTREGRFSKDVDAMIGWAENDLTYYTDNTITTAQQTHDFIAGYVPGVSAANIEKLLAMYSVEEFAQAAQDAEGLSAEFFRSARIFRDILMTCQPTWFAGYLAKYGQGNNKDNNVYLYDWNQTVLEPALEAESDGKKGWGPVHTSEFAYVFGNASVYDEGGWGVKYSESDLALVRRGSRSWARFASTGKPGGCGKDVFRGFGKAFPNAASWSEGPEYGEGTNVFVVGGPKEGLSAFDGPKASQGIKRQRLKERCGFIMSDEMIEQLYF